MTTGVLSNYLEIKLIDHVLRNTAFATTGSAVYVGLLTDAGAQDDANAGTEVTGGSYARQNVTAWDAPSAGATQNTGAINFPTAGAAWGNIRYIGIYDAVSGGNLLYWGQLTADKQVDAGDTFSIAAGDLDVSIAGAVSNYLADAWLNHTLRNTAYTKPTTVACALYTTMPDAADSGGVEVTGGSYARQTIFDTTDWDNHADGSTENTNIETFPVATANWGTVLGIGLRDAAVAGNLLFFGTLGASKTVNSGDTFRFSAGALDVSVG